MRVDYALNLINQQLKFSAKKEIVNKFSAKNDEILDFEYVKDGEVVFRHHFGLINESLILENLYLEMINICISNIPLKLLVAKGSGDSIIRPLNDDFDIRHPKKLSLGDEIDIDEPLALASVYNVLDGFGLTNFSKDAKDILSEYERSIEIPDPRKVSSLAFRFSADKLGWHSSYQSGDNYFSIYQNDSWGEAIPLISGSGGNSVTKLTDLSDFPDTHEAGKMLVSTGTRLKWVNVPSVSSGETSVIGGGSGVSYQPPELEEISYLDSGIDLKAGSTFKMITLNKETNFKVATDDSTYATKMDDEKEYKILVQLNGNTLNFDTSLTLMHHDINFEKISGVDYTHAIFNMLRLKNGIILVYNINYGSF